MSVIDNPVSGWTDDLRELGLQRVEACVDERHRDRPFRSRLLEE
jgi:hypothetical protein